MANKDTLGSHSKDQRKYKTLLEISETISKDQDLFALFRRLAQVLPGIVQVDFLALLLFDPESQLIEDFIIQANVAGDIQGGKKWQLDAHPAGTVFQTQKAFLVADISQDHRYPEAFPLMQEDGVVALCVLPLTSSLRQVGSIVFASRQQGTYQESHLEFLHHVAKQVAVAVDNVLHHQELIRERDRLSLLLEVNNTVISSLDLRSLFEKISQSLRKNLQHGYTSLALHDPQSHRMRTHILDFPSGKGLLQEGLETEMDDTPAGQAFKENRPVVADVVALRGYQSDFIKVLKQEGIQAVCAIPLSSPNQIIGTLNVGSRKKHAFPKHEVTLLTQVATQIALAIDNALRFQEVNNLKNRLAKEKLYLEEEIRTEHNFEDIIGESVALKRVLQQLEIVAPTSSTVLILGETGTGKELIARALHQLSTRKERSFVKLNCAAIPTGLLESELFGHEKGAFTGAISQKVGRFELAHEGSIFLDEIGEISLELQSKLLRVLQEQEFERLGSTKTIKVDVRLIAATNRDLESMVGANQFRSDLYYRLNVFPITVPALRERPEDIPILVRYFTQRYASRMKKPIETIPQKTMDHLSQYHWPGNVRELENLIERAVILSQGSELVVDLGALKQTRQKSLPSNATLNSAERAHILKVLQDSKWVIGGPDGAAQRLGMKRTTLHSKMKKLNISRSL
ncbi:sigma 54-interacting transcriptional regulator [Candidatus Nitronereus thalassa]|uniref:Sigma 54-interacting transcriptional regulator n=1 Tax=Candidatus Nitronereus thalassa TaxID=3020898 RepID=A0ABU3K740_9BACT|nr:sigma 54-interacting transcriptional regulator [Candidatus Nitronereus thalassa]MDT7042210.1 sigma 54-interacting transcriptional regulator [Candidatus Nitronereus thalassa]